MWSCKQGKSIGVGNREENRSGNFSCLWTTIPGNFHKKSRTNPHKIQKHLVFLRLSTCEHLWSHRLIVRSAIVTGPNKWAAKHCITVLNDGRRRRSPFKSGVNRWKWRQKIISFQISRCRQGRDTLRPTEIYLQKKRPGPIIEFLCVLVLKMREIYMQILALIWRLIWPKKMQKEKIIKIHTELWILNGCQMAPCSQRENTRLWVLPRTVLLRKFGKCGIYLGSS